MSLGFVPLEPGTAVRVSTSEPRCFTVEALLGHGGMGAVYRARRDDGVVVALKILHARFRDSPTMARRFTREARLANRVDHPKVVGVVDAGIADDGAPFLVSELLEGETFETRARLAGGTLPLEEVVRCADELLDVLAAAHARGVVHRDLKPGNLFRLPSGELRVLDFGLAQADAEAAPGESQLTGASVILGTAGFMAPELALGRWDLVDPQSDLWAVAATVLYLATGNYVHDARTAQEHVALAATRPATPMATRAPALPRDLATWLDQGLAFSKRDRFESARRMRAMLQAIGDRPASVRSSATSTSRWMLAGFILAALSTAGGAIVSARRARVVAQAAMPVASNKETAPALVFSASFDASAPPAALVVPATIPPGRSAARSSPARAVVSAAPAPPPPEESAAPAPPPPEESAAPASDPLDRRR